MLADYDFVLKPEQLSFNTPKTTKSPKIKDLTPFLSSSLF